MTNYQEHIEEVRDTFDSGFALPIIRESIREKQGELKSLQYMLTQSNDRGLEYVIKRPYLDTVIDIIAADCLKLGVSYYSVALEYPGLRHHIFRGLIVHEIKLVQQSIVNLRLWEKRYERIEDPNNPKFKRERVDFDLVRAVPILGIIEGYGVHLKKTGSQLKGCCPLHSEKTPSFIVHPDKNFWKCWSCGLGGDGIKFVMAMEKCTAIEAGKMILGLK